MNILIEKLKASELKVGDMVHDIPADTEDMPKALAPVEFEVVNIRPEDNVIVMKPMSNRGCYKVDADGNICFKINGSGNWYRTSLNGL